MQRNFRANAKPPDPKEDLLLYKKMREMISYGNGVLNNGQFPRKYRIGNAIGAQIEKSMFEAMRLINRAMANVNIMLDGDAVKDAKKLYYKLEDSSLKGRVRIIICDDGYDASTIYEKYGINGIKKLMKSKRQLNDFDRIFDI